MEGEDLSELAAQVELPVWQVERRQHHFKAEQQQQQQ